MLRSGGDRGAQIKKVYAKNISHNSRSRQSRRCRATVALDNQGAGPRTAGMTSKEMSSHMADLAVEQKQRRRRIRSLKVSR